MGLVSTGINDYYTVKNVSAGITKLFPARERLVSEIPAGNGKIANLFDSVGMFDYVKKALVKFCEL